MKSIFPALLTAACVLSNGVAAQSTADVAAMELNMIRTLTDNVTATISELNGTMSTDVNIAVQIQTLSTSLVTYIQNSTAQLQSMPSEFSTTDAFNIGGPTQRLAYSVNASIAALMREKPNFVSLGEAFPPLVVTSLQSQLNASNSFSGILLGMVPSDVRPVADALNGQITASLNQGIQCFQNVNSTCNTAVENPNRTYDAAVDSGAIHRESAATRSVDMAGFAAMGLAGVVALFAL